MQVIARVSSEPGSDRRCLVGGVIVEHQVNVEIGWHGLFDRGQKPAQFDCAVALVATADDPAGGDVKSRTTRSCRGAGSHDCVARFVPGRIGSSGCVRSSA
jgi:hypothetical protein